MANKLIYPSFNPLQMYDPELDQDEKFNSKDFEDFDYLQTILPWQQYVRYKQPWQLNDTIALHLQTNIGPIEFKVRRCDGSLVDTVLFTQKQESIDEPGMFIYEISKALAAYDEGDYYVELVFGGGVFTLRSGELVFKTLHENTLLLQGKHFEHREDVIFETGYFPSLRVRATKRYVGPKQKSTVYEDQVLNMSALRSQKYRSWKLLIGGSTGIPDYLADMIGGWIGCSDFRIDGKNYTVEDGSQLEPTEVDNYPLRGWAVDLRERYTRGSRTYENEQPIEGLIAIAVQSESKGFGNSNSGSQTIMIDVT